LSVSPTTSSDSRTASGVSASPSVAAIRSAHGLRNPEPVFDVAAHRGVEEARLLKDHSDPPPQGESVRLSTVHASVPPRSTVPASGSSESASVRSSVVLPTPEGPMTPRTSPASILMERSSNTRSPPNDCETPVARSISGSPPSPK